MYVCGVLLSLRGHQASAKRATETIWITFTQNHNINF